MCVAFRQLGIGNSNGAKSMEKLSSGFRINRAGDDAAGLSISEKMRGQIRGLNQASRNAQDSISLIQTAEGALNETQAILQRMRELAVQSSNDTNVAKDREAIQGEMDELAKEITRIANNTEFNTQKLINGGIKDDGIKSSKFQVGANSNQDITLSINAMDAKSLGVSRDINVASQDSVAGKVSSATFTKDVGAGIVDGAQISATYTAGGTTPATAAKVEGTYAVPSGSAAELKFTVDGGSEITVTIADGADIDAAISAINAAAGAAIASKDTGTLILTSGTTGASSSIEITQPAVGLTGTATGQNAQTTGAQVTLTSGGTEQKINVTGTETSISVADGAFKGLTMNFSGAVSTLDTSGTAENVLVSVETQAATAATFASGEKTADAVTEAGIDVSTQANATAAITTINDAIEKVSAERSKLGAYQNRLEHTIKNLDTSSENLQASESRIRDVDMAKEMMEFTKNNILQQAAQAMLAQANSAPQGVLQLLR